MHTSEPVHVREASQIAVGGCILGLPIALAAAFKYALKRVEQKEHDLAHQVEQVDLEPRGEGLAASRIPPDESLTRFLTSLRRVTAPFEKMGARFEPANFDLERKRLDGIKKRFESEDQPPSAEAQKMLREAEQLLARYAPPGR